MKKILILSGSHRGSGYSNYTMQFLQKQLEKDFIVSTHSVHNQNVKACIGCDKCKMLKRCIYDDDMTNLYQEFIDCDTMIFIFPIYFSALPALLKMVIDRGQLFFNISQGEKKRTAYVIAFGGAREYERQFVNIEITLEHFLKNLKAELVGTLRYSSTDRLGDDLLKSLEVDLEAFAQNVIRDSLNLA